MAEKEDKIGLSQEDIEKFKGKVVIFSRKDIAGVQNMTSSNIPSVLHKAIGEEPFKVLCNLGDRGEIMAYANAFTDAIAMGSRLVLDNLVTRLYLSRGYKSKGSDDLTEALKGINLREGEAGNLNRSEDKKV